jgi:hypothetical protein
MPTSSPSPSARESRALFVPLCSVSPFPSLFLTLVEASLELTATVTPPPSSPHGALSPRSSPLTLAFSRSAISLLHQATRGRRHCRAGRARPCVAAVFPSRNASAPANLVSSFLVSRCPRSTTFHAASSPGVPGRQSHGRSSRWPLWLGCHGQALAAPSLS